VGIRYSKIKDNREIVLLKSFPCKYGKCSFCNYILDNSTNEKEINLINLKVLKNVTGEYGVLEVINSGSVFEIPQKSLAEIKTIATHKNIKILYFEFYYGYVKRLNEITNYFKDFEVRFIMGLETFDNNFRVNVYNKNFHLNDYDYLSLSKKVFSICLLVCVKGQSKKMIENDIALGLKYFRHITVNVFIDNGTSVKSDPELKSWFVDKYSFLKCDPKVDFLIDNKDLGVFEN